MGLPAFLFLTTSTLMTHQAYAKAISLLSDEWCHYACENESGKPGLLVEIADRIFIDSDAQLEYQSINWARAIKLVRKGGTDALLGANKSDSPDFIFHKTPILYSQMCFYTQPQDKWQFETVFSLRDRTVSVINGYSYGGLMDQYMAKFPEKVIKLTGHKLIERKLMMLKRERIDTILGEKQVFEPYLASAKLHVAGCLDKKGLYIAFSPAHKARSLALAQQVDSSLAQLNAHGEIEKIIDRYGAR